jgi:uncharacterized protein YndB with AHSA1/START domain
VTEVSETRSVLSEADFEFPVETLWRAMTDSEWLAVWFFPNDILPVEGHKFTIWGRLSVGTASLNARCLPSMRPR